MTTKTFCDGCDNEILDRRQTKVSVALEVAAGAHQPLPPKTVDLCEACFNIFRHQHWPTTWPRGPGAEG